MRLATWNVNSIRTRIDRITAFLERAEIDVLAMQELKCRKDQFPLQQLTDAGYQVAMVGHDQWNGVAIVSRVGLRETQIGFPEMPTWGDHQVSEARAIRAVVGEHLGRPIELWSLYVPNGRELDHPHYAYKLQWLARLREHIAAELAERPEAMISLVGDFNIAPYDEDVWSIEFFEGKTHVSQTERDAFFALLDAGLTEVTRERVTQYTYWDYQQLRFPKNQGMRIDFVLASPALSALVTDAEIDRNERKGKGASDHVPVIVDIATE